MERKRKIELYSINDETSKVLFNIIEDYASQIINGKAKLVSEVYCDGLGACLGKCPLGSSQ